MFAFLEFNGEQFVQFGNYLLMVAGAFLVGYIVGWVLIAQVDRWIFGRRLPHPFYQVARLIVGIICAVLVAVALFGFGFGPGDGNGPGKGAGTTNMTGESSEGDDNPGSSDPKNPSDIVKPPTEQVEVDVNSTNQIEVTLLGGSDVSQSKFYLIGDDPKPKTFIEVKDAIQGQAGTSKEPLAVVIRFRAHNRLASDHFAVIQLKEWAGPKGKGYTIITPS